MKRSLVLALGCMLGLLAPVSVNAGRSDAVDPGIMQPTLNPSYEPWECWRSGPGTECYSEQHLAGTNEPTDLVCDGRTVYHTWTDDRTLRRHGDQQGLALWSAGHVMIEEVLSLQPDGSGPTIVGVGHYEDTFAYSVPGDLSTRTERYTGIDVSYVAPGVGLVFHDVGIKAFDIDDNLLMAHGPHPLLVDFDGAFQKVCDAFDELGA